MRLILSGLCATPARMRKVFACGIVVASLLGITFYLIMIALERALIHRPRLVLLDEPFTGLDDASTHVLLARLRSLRAEGAIVVVATHDLDLADGLLDRVLFLRNGRVAEAVDRPGALRETYRTVMTRGSM